MASVRFTVLEDEELIELVSENSILWDVKDPEFKNQTKRDLLWAEIGLKMKRLSSDCKRRWKSIRDHFKKQRKNEKNTPAGTVYTKKRATYWDKLNFLDSEGDERAGASNATSDIDEKPTGLVEDDPTINGVIIITDPCSDEDGHSESTKQVAGTRSARLHRNFPRPPRKKRKVQEKKDNSVQELASTSRDDRHQQSSKHSDKVAELDGETGDTDLFFKSMAATVKKFHPDLVNQVKRKVFTMIMDYESLNRRQST